MPFQSLDEKVEIRAVADGVKESVLTTSSKTGPVPVSEVLDLARILAMYRGHFADYLARGEIKAIADAEALMGNMDTLITSLQASVPKDNDGFVLLLKFDPDRPGFLMSEGNIDKSVADADMTAVVESIS